MKGGDFLTPRPKYVPDFQAGMGLLRFHRSDLLQNQCLRIATSLEEWYKLGNKRDDRFLGVVSKFYRDYPAANDWIDTLSGN